MKKKFKFSVIIPVYNAAEYLEEAIVSVLSQKLSFSECIQLILVNDGSTDNSGEICMRYRDMYEDNIEYIAKANGGVSSARNEGLAHVRGELVAFLDGDDYWDKDAFRLVYDFFESHPKEFNVCSCRIAFAGDFEGKVHPLDYKFEKGARVVDLKKEPSIISSTIGNVVVRAEAIGTLRFDETLAAGEDSLFINSLLMNESSIGIMPEAVYHYRRNSGGVSGSGSAASKVSWYTVVPRKYYLGLCEKSRSMYGEVLPFLQYVILYDLRWRKHSAHMMDILSESDKKEHIEIMKSVMTCISDTAIRKAKGLDQYKKFYLWQLKYGYDIASRATINGKHLVYNKVNIFNFAAASAATVTVFDIDGDSLLMEGTSGIGVAGRDYMLAAEDEEGNLYKAEMTGYGRSDILGFVGETVSKGEKFRIKMPLRAYMELKLIAIVDSERIQLSPKFEKYIEIRRDSAKSYCFKGRYIVKNNKGIVSIIPDTFINRIRAKSALNKELRETDNQSVREQNEHELRMHGIVHKSVIKDRVLFISCRSDGDLEGNMKVVYDALDLPKEKLFGKEIYRDIGKSENAMERILSSRVIVTDDYIMPILNYRIKPEQRLVQLWHATGAFKQFGKHFDRSPGKDRLYHRDYDLVTVSSEYIRDIYADSLQVDVSKVKATGVARTDLLMDEAEKERAVDRVYKAHPELSGKQILLYAPTFRDTGGRKRSTFVPEIDFAELSGNLRDNQVFVLCPHPVITETVVKGEFNNVIEVRDVTTADMLFAADVLITDYSSVMFECALMGKPMAFYCYDYDTYERDFYLDMDTELPGPLLKTQRELTEFIHRESFDTDTNYNRFCEKYLSACDGHSTERIATEIKRLYSEAAQS